MYCFVLFLVRDLTAVEYMDLAYFFEGKFESVNEFICNKAYLANVHRPGYMVISWLIREYMHGERGVYVFINMVAMTACVPMALSLFSINMPRKSSLIALFMVVICPMAVYSLFRMTPYTIIALLFIILAFSHILFCETGRKIHAVGIVVSVALLPFFHVMTAYGVVAYFIAMILQRKQYLKHGIIGYAVISSATMAIVGSGLFNFFYIAMFTNDVIAISAPSTARLHVYYTFENGNPEFLIYSLKVTVNLFLSFVSDNPFIAFFGGCLFASGCIGVIMRGRHGLIIVAFAIACPATLIVTNMLNYSNAGGFPMSYRHLQMLGFFFMYPIFFACDRIGLWLSIRTGSPRYAINLLLLAVFLINFPWLLSSLRSPDMNGAMNYIYENAKEYDGVIPGNIYFMNEYHTRHLTEPSNNYHIVPYPDGASNEEHTTGNFNRWIKLQKPGGEIINSIMLNIAPFSIGSFKTLLENSFIQRVWYLDNDTRFLGVLPDFPGEYQNQIRDALKDRKEVSSISFNGVTVRLYEIEPIPIMMNASESFTISAGINDYYFVRGAIPDLRVYSRSRAITKNTYVVFFVNPEQDAVQIELQLEKPPSDAMLVITDMQSGVASKPINNSREHPKYIFRKQPGTNYFLFGFNDFGDVAYKNIVISNHSF